MIATRDLIMNMNELYQHASMEVERTTDMLNDMSLSCNILPDSKCIRSSSSLILLKTEQRMSQCLQTHRATSAQLTNKCRQARINKNCGNERNKNSTAFAYAEQDKTKFTERSTEKPTFKRYTFVRGWLRAWLRVHRMLRGTAVLKDTTHKVNDD